MRRSLAVSALALSLSFALVAPCLAQQTSLLLKKTAGRPHKMHRTKTASPRSTTKQTTKRQELLPVLHPVAISADEAPASPKTNAVKMRPGIVAPAKNRVRFAAPLTHPPRREKVAGRTPLQNTSVAGSPSNADTMLENAVIRFTPIKRTTGRLTPEAEQEQLTTPVVQVARAVSRPDPEIPASLLARPFHGKVIIRIRIEADGSHAETLIQGTGDAELDAAILNGVRKWQWEPALRDGQAIEAINKVTLTISNG